MTGWTKRRPAGWICAALALGTLLLYLPVTHHPFITLDDNLYVTAMPQVHAGLTWSGIVWAFTNVTASNWHPLTWLSHMLDCQLFGLNAGAHHLVNVALHVANALLLFFWLKLVTGAVWRSAIVGALFAWHPTHVESVAWVAERKDLLCAFFWLLTMLAYARYAGVQNHASAFRSEDGDTHTSPAGFVLCPTTLIRRSGTFSRSRERRTWPSPHRLRRLRRRGEGETFAASWRWLALGWFRPVARHRAAFYLLALLCMALALLSKPMAVTLPFVLLLTDFWPLRRIANLQFSISNLGRLAMEKIPFLLLSIAAVWINFAAQKGGGAAWSAEALPLHVRVANALVSYVRYLSKEFFPTDLAVIYPYEHWPLWLVLAAGAILAVWSLIAWRLAKTQPILGFGWFYFCGTLVPVIGLVQFGPQAMADRYTYLPSIGLYVLVIWGVNELLAKSPHRRTVAMAAGTAVLGACLVITARQLQYWQSSVKLFAHTVEVTTDNYVANAYLGGALEAAGLSDAAVPFYAESVRITPNFPIAQWGLGMALLRRGQAAEAGEHLAAAARLTPNDPVIHCQAGKAYSDAGNWSAAEAQLAEAVRLKPDDALAHYYSAITLARQKKFREAIPHFSEATRLNPTDAQMHYLYGMALLDLGEKAEAAGQLREALQLQPDYSEARKELETMAAEAKE